MATKEATGKRRMPVERGPYPFRNWKYWVTRKMKPERAKKEIATEALAAVKRGFRKRVRSSIGRSVCRSQTANATASNAVSAKPAIVRVLSQPWLGASMIV